MRPRWRWCFSQPPHRRSRHPPICPCRKPPRLSRCLPNRPRLSRRRCRRRWRCRHRCRRRWRCRSPDPRRPSRRPSLGCQPHPHPHPLRHNRHQWSNLPGNPGWPHGLQHTNPTRKTPAAAARKGVSLSVLLSNVPVRWWTRKSWVRRGRRGWTQPRWRCCEARRYRHFPRRCRRDALPLQLRYDLP